MKLRFALAAATCLALPLAVHSTAQAQPVTGPYVSLGAGTSIQYPSNYIYENSQAFQPAGVTGKLLTRPSYAAVGAVGYGFGNGFRVELGGNYYRNTAHKNDQVGYSEFGSTYNDSQSRAFGAENTYGPMINAYYDFSVGLPIFPYVGAGVGYQWEQLSRRVTTTTKGISTSSEAISGDKGSFAYQIIAGIAYPLPMVPGLSLTAEYRFMQLTQSRKYTGQFTQFAGVASVPVKLGQVSSNTFLLGLRYQIFNAPVMAPAPVPAPMAAPAPATAKTYLVFFDWDKYNLTPRATQIIAQAAADSKTTGVTTLDVSGYTDTSGTATYNQGLSERRAKTVAAKLVADGVPASEISIHAFGETHLLVPTGPGVREPQNRRVEIVLN